jgi:regulator of protease activity HflC (stomatin/prohibitin superfamily)
MPTNQSSSVTQEVRRHAVSGWLMLPVNILIIIGGIALLIWGIVIAAHTRHFSPLIIAGPLVEVTGIILLCGHFTLQPNEARVLLLFGAYHGTVRDSGFFWANPFYSRVRSRIPLAAGDHSRDASRSGRTSAVHTAMGYRTHGTKISLRVRNFNSEQLKVNDKRGNPVEIASVVVWRVEDTARAAFDVDDFETYVQIQSEAAIRHIASLYSYDRSEDDEPTLRDSADEVAQALQAELRERLHKAGLAVDEARLTHLAYAPEIAQAMLRRQQAEAIIAARQKIVHGAVSMVDMALRELSEKAVVEMDEERKAAMVSNLLVVLCGDKEITPVVNTGTLYN